MTVKKLERKYYFTVEGETEEWYLKRLQDIINNTDESTHKVKLVAKKQKNPLKYAKGTSFREQTTVHHLFDYESDEACHVKEFRDAMDNMKKAEGLSDKRISYKSAYCNFTFDLWIILHRGDCANMAHRHDYIKPINKVYGENFENMDAYKTEKEFKRILATLKLEDVIKAIGRAETIMARNKENGYILHEYKKYTYYKENPSLLLHEAIKQILVDCRLILK